MENEKLTLEHLSGYLPYELPFIYDFSADKNRYTDTVILSGIDKHAKDFLFLSYSGGLMHVNHCKLILHPLSDLTKEIEVNDHKFIPLEVLNLNINAKYDRPFLNNKSAGFVYGFAAHKVLNLKNIDNNSYWHITRLLEWHFDIHGLIESGLAIDINTL